jgi:hypothetical protein
LLDKKSTAGREPRQFRGRPSENREGLLKHAERPSEAREKAFTSVEGEAIKGGTAVTAQHVALLLLL